MMNILVMHANRQSGTKILLVGTIIYKCLSQTIGQHYKYAPSPYPKPDKNMKSSYSPSPYHCSTNWHDCNKFVQRKTIAES
jgi:hypothetical protein